MTLTHFIFDKIEAYRKIQYTNNYTKLNEYIIYLPDYDHTSQRDEGCIEVNELMKNLKKSYSADLTITEKTYTKEQLEEYKKNQMEVPPTTFLRKITVKW